MINNQIDSSFTYSALNQAIASAQDLITSLAFQDQFWENLTTAFGFKYDRQAAWSSVNQWLAGNFDSFPEIEVLSSSEINQWGK